MSKPIKGNEFLAFAKNIEWVRPCPCPCVCVCMCLFVHCAKRTINAEHTNKSKKT